MGKGAASAAVHIVILSSLGLIMHISSALGLTVTTRLGNTTTISVPFEGVSPVANGSASNASWTWHVSLDTSDLNSTSSYGVERFLLETAPSENLTDPSVYRKVCVLLLASWPRSNNAAFSKHPDDCSQLLGAECRDDLEAGFQGMQAYNPDDQDAESGYCSQTAETALSRIDASCVQWRFNDTIDVSEHGLRTSQRNETIAFLRPITPESNSNPFHQAGPSDDFLHDSTILITYGERISGENSYDTGAHAQFVRPVCIPARWDGAQSSSSRVWIIKQHWILALALASVMFIVQ